MLYGRAEYESFEVRTRRFDPGSFAHAIISAAGFGEESVIFPIREYTDPQNGTREFLEIIRAGAMVDIGPDMYLMVRNPDAEITVLGRNKLWVGFDRRYDREVVDIIHKEINGLIH